MPKYRVDLTYWGRAQKNATVEVESEDAGTARWAAFDRADTDDLWVTDFDWDYTDVTVRELPA